MQVGDDLLEPFLLGGVGSEHRAAPQACSCWRAVGAAADTELDLASLEVAEETIPLGVGGFAALLAGTQRAASGQERPVMLDDVVVSVRMTTNRRETRHAREEQHQPRRYLAAQRATGSAGPSRSAQFADISTERAGSCGARLDAIPRWFTLFSVGIRGRCTRGSCLVGVAGGHRAVAQGTGTPGLVSDLLCR